MRATLIYSGGSDSFTVLHLLRKHGHDVHAISFDYRQRHAKEIEYAMAECARLNVPHSIIPIPFLGMLSAHSALTSDTDVPEGYYADDNMKKTVVPNRNMIMLAIAGAAALNNGSEILAYGAHKGDHTIYPDCRKEFIAAMRHAFSLCDWNQLMLVAPFEDGDKEDIYRWGLKHNLNYANAWTCYNGRELACGKCGSCVERLHAFARLGVEDPAAYEDREYWRTVVKE